MLMRSPRRRVERLVWLADSVAVNHKVVGCSSRAGLGQCHRVVCGKGEVDDIDPSAWIVKIERSIDRIDGGTSNNFSGKILCGACD